VMTAGALIAPSRNVRIRQLMEILYGIMRVIRIS
jgi:hypothetical protein